MNIFGGNEDFVNSFGGSSQTGLVLWVIYMHYRVFFKVKVQNRIVLFIFFFFWGGWGWGTKLSIIFLVACYSCYFRG